MTSDLIQIVQLFSSIITPIIILLLGLKINRTLEVQRASLTKDKEWLTEWAKRFYTAAIEFNSAVDECILTLFFIGDLAKQKLPEWEKRVGEKKLNCIVLLKMCNGQN